MHKFDIVHLDPLLRSSRIGDKRRDVRYLFKKGVNIIICLRRFFIKTYYAKLETLTDNDIDSIIKTVYQEVSGGVTVINLRIIQSIFE